MRFLATALFIFGVNILAKAQINIGLQGGYTLAWENYGDVVLPDNAVIHIHGFNAALALDYKLNSRYSIAAEPGFTRRGAACVPGWNGGINPNPTFPADSRFLLNYAELPLLFQMNFYLAEGKYLLSPSLGYSGAVMLWGTDETIDLDTKTVVDRDRLNIGESPWDEVRRYDHGLKGGLKLATHVGVHSVYLKSSFYYGMRDAAIGIASKNRALDVGLGYQF